MSSNMNRTTNSIRNNGVTNRHNYYEELREEHVQALEHRGNIDVLPLNAEEHEELGHKELALCHLTAMWRYSTLEEQIVQTQVDVNVDVNVDDDPDETNTPTTTNTTTLVPRSLGSGFYGDSSSVLMAVHHFNNGMGVVVDDVENIHQRCPLRFTSEFFDTFSSETKTVETITQIVNRGDFQNDPQIYRDVNQNGPPPCAVLGAFRSAVSTPLSILTGVYGIPQLSPVSSSPGLDDTSLHPLFSRLVPSDAGTSLLIAKYLMEELHVQHVGVINVNDAYGNAYSKAFKEIAESLGMTVATFSFPFQPTDEDIEKAVAGLTATNYRYFLGVIFGPEHYDRVMLEAYKQGIAGRPDTKPTFWIFGGGVQRYIQNVEYEEGSPLALVTQGAAMIQADGGIEGMSGYDRYLQAWKDLGPPDVDYFNSKQPRMEDNDEYYYRATLEDDYFRSRDPERESVFAYDAVVALGFAACRILETQANPNNNIFGKNSTNGNNLHIDDHNNVLSLEGQELFDEFVRTTFVGASGTVVIDPETTSRQPESALYVIFNAVANTNTNNNNNSPTNTNTVSYTVEPTIMSTSDGWKLVREGTDFVYNDNTTVPPPALPLLDVDANYIGVELRATGLVMAGLIIVASIAFMIWTLMNTKMRIVRASQPTFLVLICVGVLFMGLSIIPLTFDDDIVSEHACSVACMFIPWLYTIGFALVFAALYSKTKRINMLLRQRDLRRIKVTAKDVMPPLVGLVTANVLVLTLWTALSPLQWNRKYKSGKDEFGRYIESYTGCLIGNNDSDDSRTVYSHLPYILTLCVINVAALLVANIQAYQAREIQTEFNESRLIGMAMASILQSWLIGIPLLFVVHGNPQAQFLVVACIMFVSCAAVLGLIMLPKFLMRNNQKKRSKRGLVVSDGDQPRRQTSIHISGISTAALQRFALGESAYTNSTSSFSTASGEMGIQIEPQAAEQRVTVLEANVKRLEMEKADLVKEMKKFLESAEPDDEEETTVRLSRTSLEEKMVKFKSMSESSSVKSSNEMDSSSSGSDKSR